MRATLCIIGVLIVALSPASVSACDWETGERKQLVFLTWNGMRLEDWVAPMGSTRKITLPNGFELGIELDEPPREKYRELAVRLEHVPELVQINLFDLSGAEPQRLSQTYGGTNSMQGFGARGGANRVDQLGDPGITLTLLKPVCAPKPQISPGH